VVDWNAIGAVGEILGAVAVVITLLYLSKQIQQYSRSVQVAALRDTTSQWNHWSELLAMSPDLAEIVARGNHSFKSLAEADALRYGAFIQTFFDNVESNLTLVQTHKVDKDIDAIESIVRRRMLIKGYVEWWEENTTDYGGEFVDWINTQRRKGDTDE
jgi:hypothetical protein